MRRANIVVILALLTLQSGELHAQVPLDSVVDSRVQVHLARQDRMIEGYGPRQALRGRLLAATSDSLLVQIHPEASPLAVALNGVYELEVSRGVSRSRTALKHAALGAATFAGIGAMGDRELGGGDTESVLLWSAGGLILGGVLGALLPEESWRRVFRR